MRASQGGMGHSPMGGSESFRSVALGRATNATQPKPGSAHATRLPPAEVLDAGDAVACCHGPRVLKAGSARAEVLTGAARPEGREGRASLQSCEEGQAGKLSNVVGQVECGKRLFSTWSASVPGSGGEVPDPNGCSGCPHEMWAGDLSTAGDCAWASPCPPSVLTCSGCGWSGHPSDAAAMVAREAVTLLCPCCLGEL